jgi:protein-disulfide isomerase
MSASRDREGRWEERQREEESGTTSERRQRVVKLSSAAAFLAVAVVAVLVVVSQSGSSGGDSDNIIEAKLVERELAGIPQHGMVLGEAGAKVRLLEFADLQCPVCKGYAEGVLPQLIENQVREGLARIEFRNFTIIDADSTPAGAAAIAAGEQERGWNFVEVFYRNQGAEGSGYVTDDFLTAVARAAGVPDISRWDRERKSRRVVDQVGASTSEAESLGFTGTPSFAVEGSGTSGLEAIGTPGSAGSLESAVEEAAG